MFWDDLGMFRDILGHLGILLFEYFLMLLVILECFSNIFGRFFWPKKT